MALIPKFALGRIVATPGVLAVANIQYLADLIDRHVSGDWGTIEPEDARSNNAAIDPQAPGRVLSAYPIDPEKPCKGHGENCIWVITEWDRSVTTLLLPEEY